MSLYACPSMCMSLLWANLEPRVDGVGNFEDVQYIKPTWLAVLSGLSKNYVVSTQGVRMEDKRIEAVKTWPKPKSGRDIQVFIGLAKFYQRFIQGFSKIAAPLTSMLKTSQHNSTQPKRSMMIDEEAFGVVVMMVMVKRSKYQNTENTAEVRSNLAS